MDLKETNHLSTSVERVVEKPSRGNNSDKRSVYDIFFSKEDAVVDTDIDSKDPNISNGERKFGPTCTLDWLQTWRSTEIS
tara:strand:+ start:198 stop:437 length:240 start_codon:yes stop_codon:yes gene_type:complete